jgi:hypothetical protein
MTLSVYSRTRHRFLCGLPVIRELSPMSRQIDELINRIKDLEEELGLELKKRREEFHFVIEEKRVRFAEEVTRQQRRLKSGLFRYLVESRPLNVLTAPLIYSGLAVFLLLDLFLTFYQNGLLPNLRHPQGQALGIPGLRPLGILRNCRTLGVPHQRWGFTFIK